MSQLRITNSLGTRYYLWTQSTEPPLAPATIYFLSENAKMPDTVQPLAELPQTKVIVENPFSHKLNVYDRGSEPSWL